MTKSHQPAAKQSAAPPVATTASRLQLRPFAPRQDDLEQDGMADLMARAMGTQLMDMPVDAPGATIQRQAIPEEEEEDLTVQPKLSIGQPGDKYEQEADQMAARVMRMPDGDFGVEGKGKGEGVQRQALPGEKEEEEVQTKSAVQREVMPGEKEEETLQARLQAKGEAPAVPENFEGQLANHKGGGRSLSDETRGFMEPRFGADFSNVRIHETPDLANAIQAQAFTHGQDIYFNSGKYSPGSSGGKELLAHELTHVVQQNRRYRSIRSSETTRIQRQGYGYEDEQQMASVWYDNSAGMTSPTEPMSTVIPSSSHSFSTSQTYKRKKKASRVTHEKIRNKKIVFKLPVMVGNRTLTLEAGTCSELLRLGKIYSDLVGENIRNGSYQNVQYLAEDWLLSFNFWLSMLEGIIERNGDKNLEISDVESAKLLLDRIIGISEQVEEFIQEDTLEEDLKARRAVIENQLDTLLQEFSQKTLEAKPFLEELRRRKKPIRNTMVSFRTLDKARQLAYVCLAAPATELVNRVDYLLQFLEAEFGPPHQLEYGARILERFIDSRAIEKATESELFSTEDINGFIALKEVINRIDELRIEIRKYVDRLAEIDAKESKG